MSDASTVASADRTSFRGTLAKITAGCDQCEQFFARLFDELDALSADLLQRQRAAANPQQAEALRKQLRQWERRQAAWDEERAALENELESVRHRAAEASESLAQQKRQMDQQQAAWTEELRQMRRLLEIMAKRQIEHLAASEDRPPAEAVVARLAPAETSGDPVLDSVMAQFEMLQKGLDRREERP